MDSTSSVRVVLLGPVRQTALGPETGPDQDRGPGPSDSLDERPEKTAVLGPVKTGLGPIQDGNCVDLIFL